MRNALPYVSESQRQEAPTVTVDLDVVLDHFAARLPQVTHAAALSPDGRVLTTTSGVPEHCRDRLAAVGASMLGLLDGAAVLLETGRVISNIVHMDGGFMFTMRLCPQASLLVVASTDCDVRQVGQEMTYLTTWCAPDFSPIGSVPPRQHLPSDQPPGVPGLNPIEEGAVGGTGSQQPGGQRGGDAPSVHVAAVGQPPKQELPVPPTAPSQASPPRTSRQAPGTLVPCSSSATEVHH
jgi:uncharacterized protein